MLDSFAVWVVALLEILLMVDIQELDHVEILVVLLGLIIRGTNLQVHHGLFNGHGSEAKVWIRLASGVPMTLPDFCIWLQLHYFFSNLTGAGKERFKVMPVLASSLEPSETRAIGTNLTATAASKQKRISSAGGELHLLFHLPKKSHSLSLAVAPGLNHWPLVTRANSVVALTALIVLSCISIFTMTDKSNWFEKPKQSVCLNTEILNTQAAIRSIHSTERPVGRYRCKHRASRRPLQIQTQSVP